MIKQILNKFRSRVYVQIWENRIKVVDVDSGACFDDVPCVAIEKKENGIKVISAVGNEAISKSIDNDFEIVNPFSHPRALLNDFYVAEKLLQHAFHSIFDKKIVAPAPAVIIHPMEKTEGGLTTIEKKAFRELALGAGARDVALYQGPVLSATDFEFERIKAENAKNEFVQIRQQPKKENYVGLVFGVVVILCVLWLSR